MGERGARREAATADDIALMAQIAEDAMRAGAVGFSTSRTLNHRTSDGDLTPTFSAESDELAGIACGLGRAGAGVLQVISDFTDPTAEMALLRRMVTQSGRPMSFSLAQSDRSPDGWKSLLAFLDQCAADSLPVKAQVCGRPVGLLLGLGLTLNPFSAHPAWKEIEHLAPEEKLARLRMPETRARMLAGEPASDNPFVKAVLRNFERMFPLSDPPDYEPPPEASLGAEARRRNLRPEEVAYDWMLQDDGKALILFPFLNYADGNLEPSRQMMNHPLTILGLGDGGAHVGMICDGSFPTSMLTHWTRDRTRGPRLSLPQVIKAQCHDTAMAVGLRDRGLLRAGYKADLNVIDYQRLLLRRPDIAHDLPAGGRRLVQKAEGYDATIVSGHITYRHGEATGALPGRLVRGERRAP
jgi:N-acyl-D-aspartate/D-glutamate deacylase